MTPLILFIVFMIGVFGPVLATLPGYYQGKGK